jgi:hypothetical protein
MSSALLQLGVILLGTVVFVILVSALERWTRP